MNTLTKNQTMSDKATESKSESKQASSNLDIDLLLVDDETDFRESACRYLKRIGFRVDEAEDGEEALNVTVNKRFDGCDSGHPHARH